MKQVKNGRQQWIESNCTNYLVLSIFTKLIGVFVYRFSNNAPFNSTLATANDTGTLWHPRKLINFQFFCQNFWNQKEIEFDKICSEFVKSIPKLNDKNHAKYCSINKLIAIALKTISFCSLCTWFAPNVRFARAIG